MYAVVVYDVDVNKNRKVLKFLRTRLSWIQNSVFEGELTKSEMRKVENRLSKIADEDDSIIIYKMGSKKYMKKSVIGREKGSSDRIV